MMKSVAGAEVRSTRENPMEFSRAIRCHRHGRGQSRHLVKRAGVDVVRLHDVTSKSSTSWKPSFGGWENPGARPKWVAFRFTRGKLLAS